MGTGHAPSTTTRVTNVGCIGMTFRKWNAIHCTHGKGPMLVWNWTLATTHMKHHYVCDCGRKWYVP